MRRSGRPADRSNILLAMYIFIFIGFISLGVGVYQFLREKLFLGTAEVSNGSSIFPILFGLLFLGIAFIMFLATRSTKSQADQQKEVDDKIQNIYRKTGISEEQAQQLLAKKQKK